MHYFVLEIFNANDLTLNGRTQNKSSAVKSKVYGLRPDEGDGIDELADLDATVAHHLEDHISIHAILKPGGAIFIGLMNSLEVSDVAVTAADVTGLDERYDLAVVHAEAIKDLILNMVGHAVDLRTAQVAIVSFVEEECIVSHEFLISLSLSVCFTSLTIHGGFLVFKYFCRLGAYFCER